MATSRTYSPKSFESITVSSTSIPLTTIPAHCSKVFITVETDAIRFRVDSTAPTASVGHKVDAGGTITLEESN